VKRLLALLLLVGVFVPAPAAASRYDSVVHRIVLLGDSITAGGLVAAPDRLSAELAYRLCGRCNTLGDPVVENDGIGGQQLLGGPNPLVATAPPIIATLHSGDIAVVAIGMNDLFSYPGDGPWTSAYVSLVASIEATGAHPLVGQITPVAPAQWPHELLRQHLNQWESDHWGADVVVAYPDVLHCTRGSCAGQTWIDPRYGWDDGIHINEGGYAVMADLLAGKLHGLGWL
jgi:lysophospholipase L1-like esterase